MVGEPLQLIGTILARHLGQLALGIRARRLIHEVGQLGEEPADDADMLDTDQPGALPRGGVLELRGQRLGGPVDIPLRSRL